MKLSTSFWSHHPEPEHMMEINTTPLIDIMLVLLIMLIITIQQPLHSVKLALPQNTLPAHQARPVLIRIEVDQHNTVSVDGAPMPDTIAIDQAFLEIAKKSPQPELHLQVHPLARYDTMLKLLAQSQRHGLHKLGILENLPISDE